MEKQNNKWKKTFFNCFCLMVGAALSVSNTFGQEVKEGMDAMASDRAVKIRLSQDSKKCMGVFVKENEMQVRLMNCQGRDGRSWRFDGFYFQSMEHKGKCLELIKGGTWDRARLRLQDCNNSKTQRWIYDGVNQQIMYGDNRGKCVSLDGGIKRGAELTLEDCPAFHQWKITGATAEGNNKAKTIHLAKDTGKCVDLYAAKTANKNNIQLRVCHGGNAQKWLFDGNYIRFQANVKRCVDLKNNKNSNGNNIWIYECNRTNAQRWIYDGINQVIRYFAHPDKCLVVKNGSTAVGANIEFRDCDNSVDQQWKVKDANTSFDPGKANTIRLARDEKKCIAVKEGSDIINLRDCGTGTEQQWLFDGVFLKSGKDPGKCLSRDFTRRPNIDPKASLVSLKACDNSDYNQRWLYDPASQKLRYSRDLELCLHLNNDNSANGNYIKVFECIDSTAQQYDSRAQQWVFR